MKAFVISTFIGIGLFGCVVESDNLHQYVDPMIGTAGGAHNYPGATVPFGMVQLSPDAGNGSANEFINYQKGQQYNYNSLTIQGFGHLHLSGTANDPAGDISVLPMIGVEASANFIQSEFSHEEEYASPGYYRVQLRTFGIKSELTTTLRCGLHRHTFPENSKSIIRFDLGYHNGGRPVECFFKKIDDSTFVGHRFSTGYADDKRVYFAVRTSKPVKELVLFADTSKVKSSEEVHAVGVKSCLVFSTRKEEQILMKVALSFSGIAGALEGLKEISDWNFEKVKQDAEELWEKELQKIKVSSADEQFKRTFYTAVYHCYVASNRFDDALEKYKGADGEIYQNSPVYTIFGLWDTFRALHPLFTITQPDRVPAMINSMLSFYDQYGLLPVWEMNFCETHCMTGYHAVPVVADAILKDFKGFDWNKAYEAMKASAMQGIRSTKAYREYHFVPFEESSASVTKTTEYAFDDWCIAQVAKKLGKSDDYNDFIQRSGYWRNLFDTNTNFIRPKYKDGSWVPSFDPMSDHTNGKESYTEGNSWHYTFMVPQDAGGLMQAFGSKEKFIEKLDSFFTSLYPEGNYLKGMGGLIGQYAHGNQPSHHLPYYYTFAGKPWKSAEIVKQILYNFYSDRPDGIIGNEDTGGMSSWYVFNAIGLYSFNPANGEYIIGSPLSDKTEIAVPDGRCFIIKAKNLNRQNIYIQKATFNGQPYTKSYIRHADLVNGGVMELYMGNKPSDSWGMNEDDRPGKGF